MFLKIKWSNKCCFFGGMFVKQSIEDHPHVKKTNEKKILMGKKKFKKKIKKKALWNNKKISNKLLNNESIAFV